MNKNKLSEEGKKWVAKDIITDDQLEQILGLYKKKDANYIIILFAVLLTGIGILTFIMSDWARVPHFSRVLVIIGAFIGLYMVGDFLHRKRSELMGISFIILGYIVFGAGMLLTISIYSVEIYSAWPFIIWSLVGLALYFVYEHKLIFVLGMIVTTVGQFYNGLEFGSFNWIIWIVLLVGYLHFVYHHANYLFGYLFGISISLQMIVLVMANQQEYYWLVLYFLIFYLVAGLLPKESLKISLKYTSLISIFIFSMYETFFLQEEFWHGNIEHQLSFIILWGVLIVAGLIIKIRTKNTIETIDLLLFLPIFYLPFSSLVSLISMFLFSLLWLLIGYRKEDNEKVLLGTVAFLLTTFTAYIQFAWDAMNKSLFFLVGGLLLFILSFFLERQRRSMLETNKGGEE
ncbi:DUF2157 domain-containing protein [Ornithinibacillus halophilus]|uniref:Uncharacterized membrane protein n=1 Tax=Ornithinibacillus halophilus TaxID=930117 RepID=A0A1M5I1Y9_9BACI|nr:DUF2157 domain-containing protein [Ornithinibacillus halophilus]SHG22265.1 Uncharacterized membrane protein [Ornithinibacillus halophilus]